MASLTEYFNKNAYSPGGGGGGGSHYNSNNKGGDGGSGIVIIRYTYISTPASSSVSIVANASNISFEINKVPIYRSPINNDWNYFMWKFFNRVDNKGVLRFNNNTIVYDNIFVSGYYANKLGSTSNIGDVYLADLRIVTAYLTSSMSETIYANATSTSNYILPAFGNDFNKNNYLTYEFALPSLLTFDSGPNNRSLTNYGGVFMIEDYRQNSIWLASNTEAVFATDDWSTYKDLTISGVFETSNFGDGDKVLDFYDPTGLVFDGRTYALGAVYTNTYFSSNSYITSNVAPIMRSSAYDYKSFSNLIYASYYASNFDYQYSSNMNSVNVLNSNFVDNADARLVIGNRTWNNLNFVFTEVVANVRLQTGYYYFMLDLQNEVTADLLIGYSSHKSIDQYMNVANYYNSNLLNAPLADITHTSNMTMRYPLYVLDG